MGPSAARVDPVEAPGAGQVAALNLQLASAKPQQFNINDQKREYVRYCFGGAVRHLHGPKGFFLTGYDTSARVQAQRAVVAENSVKCVLAGFPAGTNLKAYTVAGVRGGMVTNAENEGNLPDTVSLNDLKTARRGQTSAPELVKVHPEKTLEQAAFYFDQPVEAYKGKNGHQISPKGFGFYTPSGTRITGQKLIAVEGHRVTIGFGQAPRMDNAARWFVQAGAVNDLQGEPNVIGADQGRTDVPDLVGATKVSQAQWAFRFDEPVKSPNPQQFLLYTDGGQKFTASAASTANDAHTIRATFGKVANFANQVTVAAVGAGAVKADDVGADNNTVGSANLSTKHLGTGPTNGPDLQGVAVDPKAGEVTYAFDEALNPKLGSGNGSGASNFWLITKSGQVKKPRQVVSTQGGKITGTKVVVLFQESDLQAAQAFTVNRGAVTDLIGNPNPVRTVPANAAG